MGVQNQSFTSQSQSENKLLARQKTWELRGCAAHIQGCVGLVEIGSNTVLGKAELTATATAIATATATEVATATVTATEFFYSFLSFYQL